MLKIVLLNLVLVLSINASTFELPASASAGEADISKKDISTGVVVVTGYGVDKEKALSNAYKNAVAQYVGVVVDSESMVKNDKLIKDDILTASNGYIQSYDLISENQADGLAEVTIRATVKSQMVFDKVKSLDIAVATLSGTKDIEARIKTKIKSAQDRKVLLQKELDDFFSTKSKKEMLKLEIENVTIEEEKAKDGKVPVRIDLRLGISYPVYAKKIEKLEQTLSNIGFNKREKADFPIHKKDSSGRGGLYVTNENVKQFFRDKTRFGIGIVKTYAKAYKLDIWELPPSMNGSYSSEDRPRGRRSSLGLDKFVFALEIKSDSGEVVYAKKFSEVENKNFNYFSLQRVFVFVGNAFDGERYDNADIDFRKSFFITPDLGNSGRYIGESLSSLPIVVYIDIDIDDIDKSKNVEIKLEENTI